MLKFHHSFKIIEFFYFIFIFLHHLLCDFRYHRSTGLIKSKSDNSNLAYVYDYDEYGRLVRAITPTGEALELSFNLTLHGGATINIRRNGIQYQTVTIQDNLVSTKATLAPNRKPYIISIGADKTLTNYEPWDQVIR